MKTRRLKWARCVGRMWGRRIYSTVVAKPEAKRTLGRSKRRWDDNIRRNTRKAYVHEENRLDLVQTRQNSKASVSYCSDELVSSLSYRQCQAVIFACIENFTYCSCTYWIHLKRTIKGAMPTLRVRNQSFNLKPIYNRHRRKFANWLKFISLSLEIYNFIS